MYDLLSLQLLWTVEGQYATFAVAENELACVECPIVNADNDVAGTGHGGGKRKENKSSGGHTSGGNTSGMGVRVATVSPAVSRTLAWIAVASSEPIDTANAVQTKTDLEKKRNRDERVNGDVSNNNSNNKDNKDNNTTTTSEPPLAYTVSLFNPFSSTPLSIQHTSSPVTSLAFWGNHKNWTPPPYHNTHPEDGNGSQFAAAGLTAGKRVAYPHQPPATPNYPAESTEHVTNPVNLSVFVPTHPLDSPID